LNNDILLNSDVKIPKKLDRDLLIDSVVEIRFGSGLPIEQVFPKIFTLVADEFPNYKESEIPSQLRLMPQFGHFSSTTLNNDSFSLGFSSRALVFNCINGYKGWDKYFNIIKKYLRLFYENKIFNRVERIGLRYINIFENTNDLSKHILLKVEFRGIDNYQSPPHLTVSIQLQKGNNQFLLNIADSAIINNRTGSILDIDAFTTNTIFSSLEDLFLIIENLHDEEKILFVNILKDEFLKQLGPNY
jgi:uncharacterized protein (TIGR04255 family)